VCSERGSIMPPQAGSTNGEMPIAFIECVLDGSKKVAVKNADRNEPGCDALSRRNRISDYLGSEVGI